MQDERYPAHVRRQGALYEAKLVDLPNCLAYGPTAREAELRAEAALVIYLRAGFRMPPPSLVRNHPNLSHDYIAYLRAPSREATIAAAVGPAPLDRAAV